MNSTGVKELRESYLGIFGESRNDILVHFFFFFFLFEVNCIVCVCQNSDLKNMKISFLGHPVCILYTLKQFVKILKKKKMRGGVFVELRFFWNTLYSNEFWNILC